MGLVQLSYGHGSRAFRAKFGDANEATFRYQVGARYPGALAHTSLRDAAVIPLAVASGGTSPVVFRRLLNFLWPSRTPPDLALRWRYMTLSFKSAPPSCGMFPLLPPPGTTCFRDRLALEPAIEAEYRKSVGSQSALDDRILREERDLWGTEEDLEADEAEIRGSLVPEMETSVAELSVVSDRVVVFLSPIHPLLRRPGPVRTGRLRVTSELSEKKIDVIDYSEEESITARDFFDSDHLNMWGLQKLNALLADDVVRRLK